MTETNNRTTLWQKCQAYLNTINHMVIFAVTIYVTFMCWYMKERDARRWHTLLCTIGYQLLMAESILCFSTTNSWSNVHSRRTNSHIHWILQVVGAILSIAGCVIEYIDRSDHFNTIHGITGLISMVFLMVSLLNGISALWATELRHYVKPVYSKCFHNFCGIFTFVVGMVSQIYSYDTGRIIRGSTPEIRVALKIAGGITLVISCYAAIISLFRQCQDILGVRMRLPSFGSKGSKR